MPITRTDEIYMREALELAERGRGLTSPNPMVGAVLVRDDKIVGRGFHARAGDPHAEALALAEAGDRARGATLYVTLEPCTHLGRTPPCATALVAAGVSRAIIATRDPNRRVSGHGLEQLQAAGVQIDIGCLAKHARRLNEFFNVYHEAGRPFVTVKWAMTLDGRTGTDSHHSRWISNEKSRQYVHNLRARHDAVLIGIGTILADDPMLNVRLDRFEGRQPKRVIIDGDLSVPRRARVLRVQGGEAIVITTSHARETDRKALEEDGHRVVVMPGRRRLVDMRKVMDFLAEEQILSVLAEGGRQIHTALLREGLVDKLVAFVSPKIVGGKSLRSPVESLGLQTMDQALQVLEPKWTAYDEDMCLEGYLREI